MGIITSTVVANATDKDIYVKVDIERSYLKTFNLTKNVSASVGTSVSSDAELAWDWNKIEAGYCKLVPKMHLKFYIGPSRKRIVYISVMRCDGKVITDSISKKKNHNVIILKDNQLVDAKKDSIWVDFSGKDHRTTDVRKV